MAKTKLNIIPVLTFGRLGVNYAERETGVFEKEDIIVPEDTEQQVIQYKDGDCETTVTVGKNSRLKLVQILAGKQQCNAVLKTSLADSSQLELVQLYIGGDTVSEIVTDMNGSKAGFTADIGYDLGSGDDLDVNLSAIHRGRKSTSEIAVSGVLRGSAQKTFKGTIDFKQGASGSTGNEKEDVVLMNSEVSNKTVPVILCAEEDVVGNHGATIGRIDERHVFYMKSRGISEEKIYEMMTRSKLTRIIRKIGDEQAEKRVYSQLGWGDDIE